MALGPEHLGRVRGRIKFADHLKESVRIVLQEETKKMEARSRKETLRMEARTKQLVEAERENLLSQLSQLIPNFDPSMLKPKTSPCQNQSPKNPMSDKASCSGADVTSLYFEDDTAKNGEQQEETKSGDLENQDEEKKEEKKDEEKKEEKKEEKRKEKKDEEKNDEEKKEEKQDEEKKEKTEDEEKHDEEGTEVVDYSNVEVPSSLQSLCHYVETTLRPQEKIMTFTIEKEVFGADRSTFVLHEDITQLAGMEEIGATVVAVYMSRHWVLLIVRAKRETVYFLDPLSGNRVVDEEAKNIMNSALKIYNSHIGRPCRKAPIWKTLPSTPKQPSSVECGYYVMRFMRDIIMDPSLEFEKKFAKGKEQASYPQAVIDEVRNEWAEFVCLHME
ncbi:unnamed protein product [Prunus armeniaca]